MRTTSQKQYDIEYKKRMLHRVPLDLQKDYYEIVKEKASEAGETINGYIKRAIAERMERDDRSF